MRQLFLAVLFLVILIPPVQASDFVFKEYETKLKISVLAEDAKFIGTSMGGAQVLISDKITGDILADSVTSGGTGNTDLIMNNRKRDGVIVDDTAASVELSLALFQPTMVTITARAPLGQPQAMVETSKDFLLIPGKDYSEGNGIIMTLPGMAVDITAPVTPATADFDPDTPINLAANVTKLCGCHIAEKSPWPPERYEVEAHVFLNTRFLTSVKMNSVGDSQFRARLKLPEPGTYQITVTAFDPKTKEGGMDSSVVILNPAKKK